MNIDQDRTFNFAVIAVATLLIVVSMIQFALAADTTLYLVSPDSTVGVIRCPLLERLYPSYAKDRVWLTNDTECIIRMEIPDNLASLPDTYRRISDSEVRNDTTRLSLYGLSSSIFKP